MRLGVFGGSFDPVHFGHLFLAERARELLELDQVLFVPAGRPPHKLHAQLTADKHRLAMLRLSVADNTAFAVSEIELHRHGPSYTVDTLTAIRDQKPEARLFLLMGADMLIDFPSWKSPAQICEMARLAVVARDGMAPLDWSVLAGVVRPERLQEFQTVPMPRMDISSTEIRQRAEKGKSLRYQAPQEVIDYIHAEGIYEALKE